MLCVFSSFTYCDDAAACHLRTLGNLIATNSEIRKILSDFSVIGRDVLARTASHAAESVRPDRDALANADRPAPSDHFEAAGGKHAGSNGIPVAKSGPSSSQAANAIQERVEDHAQHSEVTEIKAATRYVLVPGPFLT